ncbi:hypothetical protein [Pseudooceanicola marinus]|uniref:hypothetical protein n=1 Tax=Pseudooceanicola marinus TaxID=396013 RepID=UPI001CD1DCDD|nr:hypothetical protein [Pseudooceanicola marinus]MCA1336862.1 hypothetical protein [Pseudooceanicola marinus]
MTRPLIVPETMGFYRAVTATGWATFDRETGACRASTPEEAQKAEEQSRPAPEPVEPEA